MLGALEVDGGDEVVFEQLAPLVFGSVLPMALLDSSGVYRRVNGPYGALVGWDPDELVGLTYAAVTHGSDLEEGREGYERVVIGVADSFRSEKRYVRRDGSVVWGRLTVSAIRDGDGRFLAGVSQVEDISGLRLSERRLSLTVDHAPIGIAMVGLDGRWLRVNRALCATVGRREDELLALTFQDITHPDDLGPDLALLERLVAGDIPEYRLEKRYLRPDGAEVPIMLTVVLVRDLAGTPVHFIAQVEDITERLAREEALREHQRRLQLLADGAENFVLFRLRTEPALTFEYLSDGVEKLLGYAKEELMARPELIFETIHPDDAVLLAESIERSDTQRGDLVLRWQRRDGATTWTHARTVRLFEDGCQVAIEGIVYDVTDRYNAEAALRSSEQRFRALVQHASDMVVVIDEDGVVDYVTPSVTRVLGLDPTEFVGRNGWEWVHPDDADRLLRVFDYGIRGVPYPAVELRVRAVDGAWRWFEATVTDLVSDPAVGGVVVNARDIHEQKRAEEQLRNHALYDPLTGLANRALLEDRITQAIPHAQPGAAVSLVLLDLDRFGLLNATLGEAAGDRVLVAIADRLVSPASRCGGTVARFYGDVFAICCSEPATHGDAEQVAQRVRAVVSEPIKIDGREIVLGATVGVATTDDPAAAAQDLIAEATLALSQAKTRGETVSMYEPSLTAGARRRLDVEESMRRGIENEEFVLRYQPTIDLDTGDWVSAEALVRWEHPERGTIPPGEFIPVAEDSGLIIPLGRSIIEATCQQLRAWNDDYPHLSVAINLSAVQLRHGTLVEELGDALSRNSVNPANVTIEVTESAALLDGHFATIARIRDLGCRVALDDFGTSYSSLTWLYQLPLDIVKIDRSFVAGITHDRNQRAIVAAVAQLARGMRLESVGEGVEHESQAADLRLLGVDRGQGFYYARPLTPHDFAAQLRTSYRMAALTRHPADRHHSSRLADWQPVGEPSPATADAPSG